MKVKYVANIITGDPLVFKKLKYKRDTRYILVSRVFESSKVIVCVQEIFEGLSRVEDAVLSG